MKKSAFLLPVVAILLQACHAEKETILTQGLTVSQSILVHQDTFLLKGAESLAQPVLTIEGENITVDFNGALLKGAEDSHRPDAFSGTAILIKGKNITLKNATVRGYKVAVMAEGVDSLRLIDCDFSYNYRPRLHSNREREDFSDWLSYHQNDKDEWLRYGAAVYLKNCPHALVKNVTVTGGMNGLMLTGCSDGLFYNNSIHYNSGVGIGLYRSSHNRIMHNRLDWNVRGYSHGFYQRGQDSAGILVYEQSSGNTFAYNSATHSGDGFFLWAGQTTMDTGEGGCNDNLIYKNDFSYAPTNGVEVTFSKNRIVENKMEACTYGIWAGYSYASNFLGNEISDCKYGIAIEHGQNNWIWGNNFNNDSIGVKIFGREKQPADWGFAQGRDVKSKGYTILENNFENVKYPLHISSATDVLIAGNNQFYKYEKILVQEKPNENLVQGAVLDTVPEIATELDREKGNAQPLEDANPTQLDAAQLKGRQYILLDEWGPYNFQYPSIWLRNIEGDQYTFTLWGPSTGNWRTVGGEGWRKINQKTGAFPAMIIATREPGAEILSLQLEFVGEAFMDEFGDFNKKGKVFPFGFSRSEKKLGWKVRWYNYNDTTDPLQHYEAFQNLKNQPALKTATTNDLHYAWWGSPGEGVNEDKFATFAETDFEIVPGKYLLTLSSDDGAKLLLDGKTLIEHWDVHEPAADEAVVQLGGRHHLEIEHFDGGGFATLGFSIQPIMANQVK
ncbi:MAG: right-handed parallel beta-helix repeat-containing protein [Saprospiraceae bacterium]|nr:right-handed parallel beta-helix repeat-containing protein [Saprospiraceae bacterium]